VRNATTKSHHFDSRQEDCARGGNDKTSPGWLALELLVIALAVGIAATGAWDSPAADLANSRLATVYSLTEYGTWYLERPLDEATNPFARSTIDKVVVEGHLLSSKPPLLPLIMTGQYVMMRAVLGWDLNNEDNVRPILLVMTLTLVTSAFGLTLWLFLRTLYVLDIAPLVRLVMLICLAFGTQLLGFAMVLNNHLPAVAMLMASVYLAVGMGSGRLSPAPWRFFLFGLCGGLEVTFDVPGAVFVALLGIYLLVRFPKQALTWSLIGGAIPVGTQAALMVAITGSPLPVQTNWQYFLSENSYWRHPLGIDGLNEPRGTYLFHMTLGRKGVFVLFPVLLAGLAGTVRAATSRGAAMRGLVLSGALGFAILTAYYVTRTNNYGGEAYGFRWYIIAMPVLLLMGAPVFSRMLPPTKGAWWRSAFLAVLLAVSCYSSYECVRTGFKSSREWTCRILGPSWRP
jgi:hypothetical protein